MSRDDDIAALEPDRFLVELDGPGITPKTVDSALLVRLAAAYIELVQRIAGTEKRSVSLRGLEVIDKCAAIALRATEHEDQVLADFKRAHLYVAGAEAPPRGVDGAAEAVQDIIDAIPEGQWARVISREWHEKLVTPSRREAPRSRTALTLRARLVRLGNLVHPKAGFVAAFQDRTFSLRINREIAKKLAKHIYEEMDITALVNYDAHLNIAGGSLDDFVPVDEERDTLQELKAWIKDQEWEDDDADEEEWA